MKKHLRTDRVLGGLCAAALLMASIGCSRTVTGGFCDAPDNKHRMYGRVYGALGHAFVDETAKTVRISIVETDGNERLLFRKEYRVRGSDIGWEAIWNGNHELTVVIYDYGAGVQFHGFKESEPPRRNIRSLKYRFNPSSANFTEQ
ncbi:MAG: hypothetical protein KIS67_21025 [Verrucomicrobiae bacterium]|nr:hypothetical protein [Verrucomicrobiae bacterium]